MEQKYKPPGRDLDYGRVIKENVARVWRHRFLWFFGFFSGTASAFGGWSCDYNAYITEPGQEEAESAREIADALIAWLQDHLALIITVAAVGIAVGILVWLWSVFCHGAVVASVRDIERGQPVSFASAFGHGRRNFRRLFPYMLVLALAPLAVMLLLGVFTALIYLLLTSMGSAGEVVGIVMLTLLGAVAFAVTVPTLGFFALLGLGPLIAIAAFLVFNLGSRSVVLAGLRPVAALGQGLRLLFDNLSRGAMLFLISVGISIGSTIVMVFAAGLAAIPAIIAWALAYDAGMPFGGTLIAVLLSLPPVIVTILFTAALNTYFTSYWTDAWMLFAGEKRQAEPGKTRLVR